MSEIRIMGLRYFIPYCMGGPNVLYLGPLLHIEGRAIGWYISTSNLMAF
jgi:hypothetical protein